MPPSAFFVTLTEPLTSHNGRDMQNITGRRLRLSARSIRQTSTSGASFSIILTSSFRRYANMPTHAESCSRVTFLSESAAPAWMHGFIRSSSIWIPRQVHRLMHSRLTDRTGASLHTTGRRWQRTDSHGGRHALPRWRSTSTCSASTTSSDSSAYGKSRCGQRAVWTDISTRPFLTLHTSLKARALTSAIAVSSSRTLARPDTITHASEPVTASHTSGSTHTVALPSTVSTQTSSTIVTTTSGITPQCRNFLHSLIPQACSPAARTWE